MIRRGSAALFVLFFVMIAGSVEAENDGPIATILCYHVVESPSDTHFSISREEFRKQIRYLTSTGYTVIPLADLVGYYEGEIDSLPERSVVITVDDGWKCTYDIIYKELSALGIPFTTFLYPKFILGGEYSLTWDQVREMAENGVDIQSHTLSHGYLTREKSGRQGDYASWLEKELIESKRILEEKTGTEVNVLAYPYGAYDSAVAEATRKAGYSAALTCNFGSVTPKTDPFKLHRVIIDRTMSFEEFRYYLGAKPLQVTDVSPRPGKSWNPAYPVIGARILEPETVDPESVQMTLLDGSETPFFYDPRDGSVSLVLKDGIPESEQSVVVWAEDAESGERVEASWTFRPAESATRDRTAMVAKNGNEQDERPHLTGGSFE